VVLVASVLEGSGTSAQRRQIRDWLGVSPRTLARWRRWWRRLFPQSPFWRAVRGWLRTPIDTGNLPQSLLACFPGDIGSRVVSVLRFLAPITTGSLAAAITLGEVHRSFHGVPAEDA
jgi:hypothetical protein